jgi:FkbM family methyltransferase
MNTDVDVDAVEIKNTNTYNTKYGKITLLKNEAFIGNDFRHNVYWDEDTLIELKKYIDPNRNILEIGGHCGTSTIVYSSYLSDNNKIFVYEPQNIMYKILVQNITQNNLQHKIKPHNLGVFCYKGEGSMNNIDMDGGGGIVQRRYNEESHLGCNFGGIGLGEAGEHISLTTIDDMGLEDIGYIHCDAQGSENFIFSRGTETIKKYRPVILYENIELYGTYLYDNICKTYPSYKEESLFDLKKYCMEELGYSKFIDKFNGGVDTLLVP